MTIGPAYGVMFGPGPPHSHQTAAIARYKRTTLAYMGARSQLAAAKGLGIPFVAGHTRAIYSRLVMTDPSNMAVHEIGAAYEWGDWAALRPHYWVGPKRNPGDPERDMMFSWDYAPQWPCRLLTALINIYQASALRSIGVFLDADVEKWWEHLLHLTDLARLERIPVYLNGGQFRQKPVSELTRFNGLFYEAVHVGAQWEQESRENAEALLEHLKVGGVWVGIQVRFPAEPTAEQVAQWSEWFLRVRQTPDQSVTMVVQPPGSQPRELPCPDALDPARFVQAKPMGSKPQPAPPPMDSEMP